MYIVFLVLVIQHGSFSGNRTEVFPLGDQSSCTALWRRIETSRSEWRIGKWKKTSEGSHEISMASVVLLSWWDSWDPARVEVPWWFLGHTMGSQTRNRWKETAVLFLGVWNNWNIWSIPSCWSMTFLDDFCCWGGRLTILWMMTVYLWRRIQCLRIIMDKREKSWHLTNHLKINQRWIRRVWIN